ncbi:hypothetical protein N0V90_012108 [Kalmusia sp. IMI 367209]|nr:hypothetical protein N0V90_012108 [Kalmusia sp. IMI 367209]
MDLKTNTNESLVAQAISTVLGVSAHAIQYATTFVELGGDSLSAILVSAECQKRGLAIPAGVFLRAPTLEEAISFAVLSATNLPPSPISLSPSSSTFPDRFDDAPRIDAAQILHATDTSDVSGISAKDVLDKVDATKFTESQLLLLRGSLDNPKLNIVTLHETYAEWDIETVRKAWTNVILSEPIFADLIEDLDTLPQEFLLWQASKAETEAEFEKEVASALNAGGAISRIAAIESQDNDKDVTVVWRIHHAFIDGFSARILRDKVNRSLRGEYVAPGPSFRSTTSLLRTFQDERREATRYFWASKREQYPSAKSQLRLAPQRTIKKSKIAQGRIAIEFPDEQLAAATANTGYTRAVYIGAAWALTLSKFLDTEEVSFGLVFSGRDLPIPGAFEAIGPLINILPLFASTKDYADSGADLLRRIHDGILELNNVQHSEAADGFDRHFDSVMATQFECDHETAQRADMQSGVPLNIIIEQKSRVQLLFSTAQYTEADAANIRSVFQHSMNSLLQSNSALLDTLPSEMDRTVRQWSNCDSLETLDASKGDDLVTLFENAVARRPNDTAVIQGSFSMSYNAFDQAAGIVAHKLKGIERNEAICVFADRSVNWLIAIFGILKAGGVYAPLDPSAPVTVRQMNFERSGARTLLVPATASRTIVLEHNETTAYQTLVVEEVLTVNDTPVSIEYPRRRLARPDDLAYICFTSGSTGRPKAVQCTHKGLVAFQKDREVRLGAGPGVVVAQIMSPVFDGSIHEIFSALTYGAALRLASKDQEEPFTHLELSNSAILTPSIAKAISPSQYPQLQNVYLVGEAVPQNVCDIWARSHQLYNMYGPTEATCGATIQRLLPDQPVTLGRANPSSRFYILDRNHRLLPPGAVGEVYLAGIQVSLGYIGLPDQNKERFLGDSVMPETNQMMYKTGDFGYWDSATGHICLLGRKDRQIKLRGFRLDLDDLEVRVRKAIPGCETAAIFRREDHLVAAYLAPSVSATEAKALIRTALPPYAMPRSVLSVEQFPLTPAGKLDYKALEGMSVDVTNGPLESQEAVANVEMVADVATVSSGPQKAMMATEQMLVENMRNLLNLDSDIVIDHESDFMMLGGHSILQLQLANRISTHFGQRFTVRTIIENPTVAELAAAIDAKISAKNAVEEMTAEDTVATLGEHGVSPIEADWFWKYKKNLGTSSFNVSHVSELDATFNEHNALLSAWNTVLARHSILRCRFRESAHGVERVYALEAPTASFVESFDVQEAIDREFQLEIEDPVRVLHTERRYQDTNWDFKAPKTTANFWTSYLSGMDLSGSSYMKQPRTSYAGESVLFQLSNSTMSNLSAVSRSKGLTLHQVALGIVSLVLQADNSSKQDLLLGSPYLGRQEEDMRTVGLFLQPLPIRISHSKTTKAPITSFLKSVQRSAQSALAHGTNWNSLLDILASSDDETLRAAAKTTIPNHPLFNAMVTFHELGQAQASKIAGIEPLISWARGSKFAIMFEFSAVSASEATLRIEFDSELFSAEEVRRLAARIDTAFGLIGEDVSVEEVENSILAVGGCELGEVESGTRLQALARGCCGWTRRSGSVSWAWRIYG